MSSDYKVVIASIEFPIDRKTHQIKRKATKEAKKQKRNEDNIIIWNEHTIDAYQTQDHALNTIDLDTINIPATLAELDNGLEDTMAISKSILLYGQTHDNTATTNEHTE